MFRIGDRVRYTRETPNDAYWDKTATVLEANQFGRGIITILDEPMPNCPTDSPNPEYLELIKAQEPKINENNPLLLLWLGGVDV